MQPRLNVARSAGELIEEEIRRFFLNKSSDALRNMPVKEILTSKVVDHINTYYKFGKDDFISFVFDEDRDNLRLEDPNIVYDRSKHTQDPYVWAINFLHDYDNFCRKLPFWTLSLSIIHKKETMCAYLLNPFLDILLFCEKGSGAVNNQRKIRANTHSDQIVIGSSGNIEIPKVFESFRKLTVNSVSIELIYLSRGLIDFYIMNNEDFEYYQDCILVAKESGIIIDKEDNLFVLANERNLNQIKK